MTRGENDTIVYVCISLSVSVRQDLLIPIYLINFVSHISGFDHMPYIPYADSKLTRHHNSIESSPSTAFRQLGQSIRLVQRFNYIYYTIDKSTQLIN